MSLTILMIENVGKGNLTDHPTKLSVLALVYNGTITVASQ